MILKYTLVYQALLSKLRQLDEVERKRVMENVFLFSSKSKNKEDKKRLFYDAYKRYIFKLDQQSFENFIENLFDRNSNPF